MHRRPAWLLHRALLGVTASVFAIGCGPESTTATISAIEPFDLEDCQCDVVTGDDGIARVEHRLFGCVPVADLVHVRFDLPPSAHGLARTGYPYLNGVAGEDSTLRSVVAGVAVGSTLPATVERQSAGFGNGTSTFIRIPELDARVRAAIPPPGSRPCPR